MSDATTVDGGEKRAAGKATGGAKAGGGKAKAAATSKPAPGKAVGVAKQVAGKPVAERLNAERLAAFKKAKERKERVSLVSWESLVRVGPTHTVASNVSRRFALDLPDYADIRDKTEDLVGGSARALGEGFHETALQIHLQRIVYAFVSSALKSAEFADKKQDAAREFGSKLRNEARDGDRSGVAGFSSAHERLRDLAASTTLQAYALMAAAEGALSAYEMVIGEAWKPFAASSASGSVSKRAVDEEMSAFDRDGGE